MLKQYRLIGTIHLLFLATFFRPTPAPAVEIVKLLPADTEIICSCNVRTLLESPVLLKVAAMPETAAEWRRSLVDIKAVRKQFDVLGIDFFTEVTRISCAGKYGSPPIKPLEGIVIIEGKIKAARLKASAEKAAKKDGASFKTITVDGVEVWEWSPAANADGRVYVVALNAKTLLLTVNKATMTDVLAQAADKKTVELNESIRILLERADPKELFTCVGKPLGVMTALKGVALPVTLDISLPRITRLRQESLAMSVGVNCGDDTKITIGFNTASAEAARKLRRRVARLSAIGALVLTSFEDEALEPWEELLRGMRVKAEGTIVYARTQVATESMEKILKGRPPIKVEIKKP